MTGELRGYIWYYCCLALPTGEQALREDLAAFLSVGEFFRAREPANAPRVIGGHSLRSGSIWVRPYRLNVELRGEGKKDEPGRFLYPGEGIAEKLAPFARTTEFSAWRDRDDSRDLTAAEMVTMKAIMGSTAPRRLPYDGVVLFGSTGKREVTWIGVRANPAYARLSSAQISKRLRLSPSFILPALDAKNACELPGTTSGLMSLTPETFAQVSADVVASYGSSTKTHRAFAQTQGNKNAVQESIRAKCTIITEQRPADRPTELVIISDLAYADVEDAAFEAVSALHAIRNVQLKVFAREQLAGFITARPWLWSKYFGRRYSFRVELADGVMPLEVGNPEPQTSIPFVERAELNAVKSDDPAILLVGRPGSGKSAAVRHLAQQVIEPGTAVIADWPDTRSTDVDDEELIANIITDTAITRRVVVILDDLDTPERTSLFAKLIARKLPAILLASALHPIEAGAAKTVSLDVIPHKFRLELLRAAAAAHGIPASSRTELEEADDDAMFTCGTPREIIQHVERHKRLAGCLGRADLRQDYWRSRFAELSDAERDVLSIIAILRRLGIARVSTELLEEAFAPLHDIRRFEDTVASLRKKWIFTDHMRILCTPVLSDDFFISKHTGMGQELSSRARSVLRTVLTSSLLSDEFKRALINNQLLTTLLENRLEDLALVLRTEMRFDVPPARVKSLAGELLRVGARDDAANVMQQHFREYSDDYDAWTWPVTDALLHENLENALWALRQFLHGAALHPEWADIDDYDHAHPTPEHIHNFLNSFRHHLRMLPEFQVLVREVLSGSPWIQRMERMLKGYA